MKHLPEARVVILAFVFAVAAALPFITTSVVSREFYFFDVTLTSTNASTTQVFWDLGRGFNEYDSSRQPLRSLGQEEGAATFVRPLCGHFHVS